MSFCLCTKTHLREKDGEMPLNASLEALLRPYKSLTKLPYATKTALFSLSCFAFGPLLPRLLCPVA